MSLKSRQRNLKWMKLRVRLDERRQVVSAEAHLLLTYPLIIRLLTLVGVTEVINYGFPALFMSTCYYYRACQAPFMPRPCATQMLNFYLKTDHSHLDGRYPFIGERASLECEPIGRLASFFFSELKKVLVSFTSALLAQVTSGPCLR